MRKLRKQEPPACYVCSGTGHAEGVTCQACDGSGRVDTGFTWREHEAFRDLAVGVVLEYRYPQYDYRSEPGRWLNALHAEFASLVAAGVITGRRYYLPEPKGRALAQKGRERARTRCGLTELATRRQEDVLSPRKIGRARLRIRRVRKMRLKE